MAQVTPPADPMAEYRRQLELTRKRGLPLDPAEIQPRPGRAGRTAPLDGAGTSRPKTPGRRSSQGQDLVALAASALLFHTPQGEAHATFEEGGHSETWPVRSSGFRDWLAARFFHKHDGETPSRHAMEEAVTNLEGCARRRGETREVYIRVAQLGNNRIFLDLCDPLWRAVEITADGWCVTEKPPVAFVRRRDMLPLPEPERGGTVDILRTHLNPGLSDGDWRLIAGFTVDLLRPRGAHPILAISGEQGSLKTTTLTRIRAVVDPHAVAPRRPPRNDRDIAVAVRNSYVICYQNLSTIPPALADMLCAVATGGGFGVRELYSDGEEALFCGTRPILYDGIPDLADRADFVDRCVHVTLPRVEDGVFMPDEAAAAAFEKDRPKLLGAFLDAASMPLRNLPTVQLPWPRMASFAHWVVAAEPAMWPTMDGQSLFMAAYGRNRADAMNSVLDGSSVVPALLAFFRARAEPWHGSIADLYSALSAWPDHPRSTRDWPRSPKGLGNALCRVAPALRAKGLAIEFLGTEGHGRRKAVWIAQASGAEHGPHGPQIPANASGDTVSGADHGADRRGPCGPSRTIQRADGPHLERQPGAALRTTADHVDHALHHLSALHPDWLELSPGRHFANTGDWVACIAGGRGVARCAFWRRGTPGRGYRLARLLLGGGIGGCRVMSVAGALIYLHRAGYAFQVFGEAVVVFPSPAPPPDRAEVRAYLRRHKPEVAQPCAGHGLASKPWRRADTLAHCSIPGCTSRLPPRRSRLCCSKCLTTGRWCTRQARRTPKGSRPDRRASEGGDGMATIAAVSLAAAVVLQLYILGKLAPMIQWARSRRRRP